MAGPGAASEDEASQYEFLLSSPHWRPQTDSTPSQPLGLQVLKRREGVPSPSSWVWGLRLPPSSLAQAPL